MSKNTAKAALLVCMCAILCACSAPPAVSGDSPATSAQPDIPQSESTTSQAASTTTAQTTTTATPEPDEPQAAEPEYTFVPVLTEDDIEYMGIPYKDLTLEQFIQLWAQSTRECNLQRLYVITYNNAMPEYKPEAEHYIRDEMQQQLVWASRGFMPYRYDDVELIEDDLAPEGYYDNSNAEVLFYRIRYKDIGFYTDYGAAECNTEESWISVRKINGYWKIGIQFSSSPPSNFFTDASSEQPDIPQSESTTTQSTATTPPEPDKPQADDPEYNFVSVLTEDDIEYMGIPYKDLTLEQFIQLWAQSTRECNVQRLYVITYNNYSYTDEITGELREPTELETEEVLKEYVWRLTGGQLEGRVLFMYKDVELFKVDDAPDGYYDSDDSEEHFYRMESRRVWNDFGNIGEEHGGRWITIKKINGYWKIGIQFSSGPSPFWQVESASD